jgi:hypothetical protein
MPPPPPEAVLVEQARQQGDAQKTQATLGHQAQMEQMKQQAKDRELALHAQIKQAEQQGALALQQSNDQRQSALDQQKATLEAEFKQRELDTKIQVANIEAAKALEVARIGQGYDTGAALLIEQAQDAGYGPLIAEKLDQLTTLMGAEKEVVRDANGRPAGVRVKTDGAGAPTAPSNETAYGPLLASKLDHLVSLLTAEKEIVRDANDRPSGVRLKNPPPGVTPPSAQAPDYRAAANDAKHGQKLDQLHSRLDELGHLLTAEKEVVRDEQGRASGVRIKQAQPNA